MSSATSPHLPTVLPRHVRYRPFMRLSLRRDGAQTRATSSRTGQTRRAQKQHCNGEEPLSVGILARLRGQGGGFRAAGAGRWGGDQPAREGLLRMVTSPELQRRKAAGCHARHLSVEPVRDIRGGGNSDRLFILRASLRSLLQLQQYFMVSNCYLYFH